MDDWDQHGKSPSATLCRTSKKARSIQDGAIHFSSYFPTVVIGLEAITHQLQEGVMEMKLAALPRVAQSLDLVKLLVFAAICVAMAELAGPVTIPLGGAYRITLLPFLWAMLIGVVWGIASPRLPGALRLDMNLQRLASLGLQLALLLFIAKLGLLVGGSLPRILDAGWALMFQEFGHFFGTAMVGLPIALLLGIKREAIGATFSVGREPSLAIIGERYGMDSPEGRGVLAEYITGTVFGTIFISLFASLVTSLGIFHPRALAMGAGMGSGSLMAAAASAISAQQSPEIAKEVAAFAAASNLITTTIGTYFTLFLSLPFTVWAYAVLEPIFRRGACKPVVETYSDGLSDAVGRLQDEQKLSNAQIVLVWVGVGLIALAANYLAFRTLPDYSTVAGLAVILSCVAVGYVMYRAAGGVFPAVLSVSLLAMVLTFPTTPYAADVAAVTNRINFLALATPVIALAGLSISKDLPAFRKLGWRIVVVSLAANAGTFVGGAFVAQIFMGGHP
ncbi:hypothetical protein ABH973_000650 [Bradyrhizobium ottawaense]|uniref:DUF3100 domain-containing protein n=1 Tax=Bradyrhizobium TaxID=374 RepID=UPI001FEF6EBF|nr:MULTISPECIES: DUF3100 domain-containing protein [Bradyrhizobium]